MASGPLNYSQLPRGGLGPRQIRLIRILPGTESSPIHCKMTVADLPAEDPEADALSPNYIHCDHWVANKPEEAYGAQLHRDARELQEQMDVKERKRERLSRGFNNFMHRRLDKPPIKRGDFIVPVFDMLKMVTRDDIVTVMSDEEINEGFKMNLGMLDDHDNLQSNWDGPVVQIPMSAIPMFYRNYTDDMATSATATASGDNYLAMSYEWGDPNGPNHTIFINGHAHEVRENLHAGLSQFRKMEYFLKGGKIWIDALCINQSNDTSNKEKTAQLKLMGSIYLNAGNIIVWLGEADEYSEKAIRTLQKSGTLYRTEYIEAFDNADPFYATAHREVAYFRLKASMLRWSKLLREYNIQDPEEDVAMYNFFNRSYWRRLWIIQELANGRPGMPIVCGSTVTQWRYIRDGAFMYTSQLDLMHETISQSLLSQGAKPMTKEHSVRHVAGIAQLEIVGHRKILPDVDSSFLPIKGKNPPAHGPLKGSPFKQALMLASRADVFDPKDRVYGMLQIPSLPELGIEVDYTKSVGTIYREFAQAAIEKGRALDILFLLDGCGFSLTDSNGNPVPGPRERLPSWVPDFGAKRRRHPGVIEGEWYAGGNRQGYTWVQDGIMKPFYPAINGDTLSCWGFVVERIDGVGAINPMDIENDQIRPGSKFKTGVVQPAPGQTVTGYYEPGDPEIDRMDEKIAEMISPSVLPYSLVEKDFPENDRDPIFYYVFCGGTTLSGAKAPPAFGCLTRSFSTTEPPPEHPHHRNWHFVNSNATLLLRNRPLSSWFQADPTRPAPDATKVAAVMQSMQARTRKRRLIVTGSGLLGLAPIMAQPGDCVMILIGHGVPVVARPVGLGVEGGSGREVMAWHLIGEAFVDGMMEEEMMKRDIWSGRKELEPLHFI